MASRYNVQLSSQRWKGRGFGGGWGKKVVGQSTQRYNPAHILKGVGSTEPATSLHKISAAKTLPFIAFLFSFSFFLPGVIIGGWRTVGVKGGV